MKLTLKNIEVNNQMSEETICFSATVCVDNHKIGTVVNRGHGGSNEYQWTDPMLGHVLEDWAEKEVIVTADPTDPEKVMFVDFEKLDWKINEIIEAYEEKKWFKSQCRGRVVFRLKGDDDESWRTLKLGKGGTFTAETKEWMVKRYGDDLGEIANETRV